jgi:hypothetical protein
VLHFYDEATLAARPAAAMAASARAQMGQTQVTARR